MKVTISHCFRILGTLSVKKMKYLLELVNVMAIIGILNLFCLNITIIVSIFIPVFKLQFSNQAAYPDSFMVEQFAAGSCH